METKTNHNLKKIKHPAMTHKIFKFFKVPLILRMPIEIKLTNVIMKKKFILVQKF